METGAKIVDKGPSLGIRHLQVLLLFLLLAIGVGMRAHLSVAIVAMTDNSTSPNPQVPTYNWDNKSVILSSYFWGYAFLQLIAGEMGRRFGTKKLLTGAMLINATVYMLVPIMASWVGSMGLIGVRVVQGMSQGVIYPSIYNQLGRWAPVDERSRLGSIALAGSPFGTIVTLPIVGYISSSWIGWPFTFYLYGILGYSWIILWLFFGASYPGKYKGISQKERSYIEESLNQNMGTNKLKTPWKSILTSLPVFAITVTYFGQNWGYTILLTEMPNYLSKVMKVPMLSNGVLSSVPYLICFVLSFFCGSTADYLINNRYLSRGATRKLFTSIASIIPTISLLVLCYLPESARNLSVLMLILPIASTAAQYGGSYINHIDLSPNFAGIILAITNTIPNMCSIFGPLFVHVIVEDESDRSQWRIVFITAALMYLISNVIYVLSASGEVQPWNDKRRDAAAVEKNGDVIATTTVEREMEPLKI